MHIYEFTNNYFLCIIYIPFLLDPPKIDARDSFTEFRIESFGFVLGDGCGSGVGCWMVISSDFCEFWTCRGFGTGSRSCCCITTGGGEVITCFGLTEVEIS